MSDDFCPYYRRRKILNYFQDRIRMSTQAETVFMKSGSIFLALILLTFLSSFAQEEERSYSQGLMFGIMGSNRGSGIEVCYQRGQGKWQQVYNLDFYFIRSLHEVKVEPYPFPDRKYVFGKLNNFWVLSPSFGMQYKLSPTSASNLVDTRIGAKVGPAIGILNPYYIKLCGVNGQCYYPEFDPGIHSYQAISGRANIFQHQLNPSFRLGLSLKTFATLDFHADKGPISALRMGINADFFPNQIPIMLESEDLNNPSTFLAATIGLVFGGNW